MFLILERLVLMDKDIRHHSCYPNTAGESSSYHHAEMPASWTTCHGTRFETSAALCMITNIAVGRIPSNLSYLIPPFAPRNKHQKSNQEGKSNGRIPFGKIRGVCMYKSVQTNNKNTTVTTIMPRRHEKVYLLL
jgi:hypothetical protein